MRVIIATQLFIATRRRQRHERRRSRKRRLGAGASHARALLTPRHDAAEEAAPRTAWPIRLAATLAF